MAIKKDEYDKIRTKPVKINGLKKADDYFTNKINKDKSALFLGLFNIAKYFCHVQGIKTNIV